MKTDKLRMLSQSNFNKYHTMIFTVKFPSENDHNGFVTRNLKSAFLRTIKRGKLKNSCLYLVLTK